MCRNTYKSTNRGELLAKKPTGRLTRGCPPQLMKKYKILRCNTPKFRCLVVETAFLGNLRGRFEKIQYLDILWAGKRAILAKNPTWRLTRGEGGGINEKDQILWGNTPKFRTILVETAFLKNTGGRFWIMIGILAKYPTWRLPEGMAPQNMKKNRILWGKIPKFRTFLDVSAFCIHFYLKVGGQKNILEDF